jgi:hypothetical protein
MINRFRIALLAAGALFALRTAPAQVLYGSLTGFVLDSSGAAIPGARVEALAVGRGVRLQALTDDRGSYLFSDLQAGNYTVSASAPAFGTLVQENILIEVNTTRHLDVKLNPAQVNSTVTVSAEAAVLQTDRADVNHEIQSTQMSNLPVTSQRDYQSLLALVPGVSPPTAANSVAGNPQGSLVSNVNGVANTQNNTRLDGASNIYTHLPAHVAYIPPAEAIETVNVVTNSFDAEQGMAGGAVINLSIKSGTNQFHGSTWWYNTDSALKARNFFYQANRLPKYILNQGGGAVGGPIRKNKLFFFADWEITLQRQNGSALQTIANDALRQGNFSGTGASIYDPLTGNPNGTGRTLFPNSQIPSSRLASAAVKMASLVPEPNLPTFPSNYFGTGSVSFSRNNVDTKVNYNPSANVSLFGRYSFFTSRIVDPSILGAAGGDATLSILQPGIGYGLVQSSTIGGTVTITPRLLVDGTVGYTRQVLGDENTDLDTNYGLSVLNIPGTNGPDRLDGGKPGFMITGWASLGDAQPANPFRFADNQVVTALNVTWVKGAHSVRFGGEMRWQDINHFQPQNTYGPRGGFSFTGGLTALNGGASPSIYNSWADFLLGQANGMGISTQLARYATVRHRSYSFYARDHWQVSRKFTLTYGLRWERYAVPNRDHTGFDRFDLTTLNYLVGGVGNVPDNTGIDAGKGQFLPRVGFAWRPTEKTVIRGGYGLNSDASLFGLTGTYPAIIATNYTGATSYQAAGSLVTGIPLIVLPSLGNGILPLPAGVSGVAAALKYRRAYVESMNITIQHDMGAGFTAQAGYVGTHSMDPAGTLNLNTAGPGGGNAGRPYYPIVTAITLAGASVPAPFGRSAYNSLQTQLTRRLGSAQLGLSYTFSKSIDATGNTATWIPALFLDKGFADFDRTHNFTSWGVVELPFGRNKRWFASGLSSKIFGGWQLNDTVTRMTGLPFTVTAASTSLNAPGNNQTADQVNPDVKMLGGIGPNASWFDPAAFVPVTGVRFGTSGRNILRGPNFFEIDVGLSRSFAIKERAKVQFRAEAFNLTNTPQFYPPGVTFASLSAGNSATNSTSVSLATRNSSGAITALNGYSSIQAALDTSRQIRFSLKLTF